MKLRSLVLLSIPFVGALVVGASASPPAPRIIVIATAHDADARMSEVRWVELLPAPRTVRTVSIPHARGAVVRGDHLGDVAFVVADDDGDPEYGSTLYRVDASGPSRLATNIVHASRPLASPDGFVYVERGSRGAQRIDALSIDAIDAVSGASHRVLSWSGFALHLAGEHGGEIIVYRVDPSGASLVGLDRATGSTRTIATIAPYARDFSVANGAIVFSNRDDRDPHLWTIERVDLASGARTRLHDERGDAPAPFAFPSGDVAWTAPRRAGLFLGGKTIAPLGLGFDDVRATDGSWIVVAHVPSSGYDETYVYDRTSGAFYDLSRGTERIEPIGFVASKAVLR